MSLRACKDASSYLHVNSGESREEEEEVAVWHPWDTYTLLSRS